MKIQFKVEMYRCGECAKRIKDGLLELPGVSVVDVDLEKELVSLVSDRRTSLEDIVRALYGMGYSQAG